MRPSGRSQPRAISDCGTSTFSRSQTLRCLMRAPSLAWTWWNPGQSQRLRVLGLAHRAVRAHVQDVRAEFCATRLIMRARRFHITHRALVLFWRMWILRRCARLNALGRN